MAEPTSVTGPALLVPITLEAVVLTGYWGTEQPHQRWHYNGTWAWGLSNYRSLKSFGAVDPDPLSQPPPSLAGFTDGFSGVVLHWALPDALTRGTQGPDGEIAYPPIPNRWLVVRKAASGDGTTWDHSAWVVVSDAVGGAVGASYPPQPDDPLSKATGATILGASYALAGWPPPSGVGQTLEPPLTAVGPGNPTFAANVPGVDNVLSFADPLTDVAPGELTYSVYGWYAELTLDPMFGPGPDGWQTMADWQRLMDRFLWTADADAEAAASSWATAHGIVASPAQPRTQLPTRTVCHGLLFGLDWLGADGSFVSGVPPQDRSQAGYVEPQVAIGNTAIDALVAMLANGADDATDLERVLQAFGCDGLPLLDGTDGPAQVFERVQSSWHGTSDGGAEWIVADPGTGAKPRLTAEQARWLTTLNTAERQLDDAERELAALQWQLYGYWTMEQSLLLGFPPVAPSDPRLVALESAIPTLQNAIDAQVSRYRYERQARDRAVVSLEGLLDGPQLNRLTRPPFQRPVDPVVLLNGVRRSHKHGEDGRFTSDGRLFCRFSGQAVSAIAVDVGAAPVVVTGTDVPQLDLGGHPDLPPEIADLEVEQFFLDPLDAPWIATKAAPSEPWRLLGAIRKLQTCVWNAATSPVLDPQALVSTTAPDGSTTPGLQFQFGLGAVPSKVGVEAWAPPWTPLFLAWQMKVTPSASEPANTLDPALWSLAPHQGLDPQQDLAYDWVGGAPPTTSSFLLQGRVLLAPQAPDILAARIAQTIDRIGAEPELQADLWAFQAALEYVQNADLLAQSLSGFNAALIDRKANTVSTSSSVGVPMDPTLAPYLDPPGAPSFLPQDWPVPAPAAGQFNPVRAGHGEIAALWVIDAFGQVFDVLGAVAPDPFLPIRATDMVTAADDALIQLKPRITQPSRLVLDLLDAADDGREVGVSTAANPVCGWVMPNHLDGSLLVYDAEGHYCGELLAAEGGAVWLPPPESGPLPASGDPVSTSPVADILNAHLGAVVAGVGAALQGVESVIALANAAATGKTAAGAWIDDELQVLLGRPLAVVRGRLRLELDSPLAVSQAWADIDKADTGGFERVRFPIQLGSTELADDGVAGYWLNDDYRSIQSAYTVADTPSYAGRDRPLLGLDQLGYALLTLLVDPSLDVHAVSGTLPTLSVTIPHEFSVPDLSRMEATFRTGPVLDVATGAGVTLPLPAMRQGTWSWLEYDDPAEGAVAMPVCVATALPALPDALPLLRNGWLRLVLAPPPTRLTYSVAPAVVPCGIAGARVADLAFSVYNGTGAAVTCVEIALAVAVGAGADDLTTQARSITGSASVPDPGGTVQRWNVSADGHGGFSATPPPGGADLRPGTTLTLVLARVRVSPLPGSTSVAVTETAVSAGEAAATTATAKRTSIPITKAAAI